MKHSLSITLLLLWIFFLAQVAGLVIVGTYVDVDKSRETGKTTWEQLPLNLERPEIEESTSYTYLFAAMLIGTLIAFFLIRLKAFRFWKLWFFLAVTVCLTIAFGAFIPHTFAFILALPLALWKIYKPNILVHNLTELFVYGGIAAIFVPILNMFSITILL